MVSCNWQSRRSQAQQVLMNKNVVDSLAASIIFAALSTGLGLILQAVGFSTQASAIVALLTLFALLIVFFLLKFFYPIYARWLVAGALRILEVNDPNDRRMALKKKIVEQVLQENSETHPTENSWIKVYENQEACELNLKDAFRKARRTKILTIRGEKYFSGARSLFYNLLQEKRGKNSKLQVLVLSPESSHINDELAQKMGQHSAKEIKRKMLTVLEESLIDLENQNRNFEVRCYDETPNFKILLFDDVMFVSAYIEPKNDQNANMLRITREGTPLFSGLEKHFDDLWERSTPPTRVLDGGV